MKKVLASGLAALALVLLAQGQASAWHKCNFGVGLNWSCEGGGNCVLWGLLKGAPTPGQTDGNFDGDHGFHDGHAMAPDMIPGDAAPLNAITVPPTPPTPKPMPTGTPNAAQPVGYFPYADPAVGYYPAAKANPTYAYPMYYYYYYYPMYGR